MTLTLAQMLDGVTYRDGTVQCAGMGSQFKGTQLKITLSALTSLGVVTATRRPQCTEFTVNLEWKPTMVAAPKRLQTKPPSDEWDDCDPMVGVMDGNPSTRETENRLSDGRKTVDQIDGNPTPLDLKGDHREDPTDVADARPPVRHRARPIPADPSGKPV
ncbi:hypothetical protein [Zavarzinia sp. CC-PAN008]|uniref:hypothetical protein n=1 Tax=Zavarzinia sp. CC-PAN008 TaxID=3243332 RepID=UPI003F744D9B